MRFTLAEVVEATSGIVVGDSGKASGQVTGLTWDSRNVCKGDLYVALPGQRVDGHDFVSAAACAGAACALVSRIPADSVLDACETAGCAVVKVADTAQAIVELARVWRTRIPGRVIGITGSTGKTTTKNLVRDVLSAAGRVCATKGNQNNELGVPATLLSASADDANVIVEMGMRGLHQIDKLCEFVRPDWGLVANVGESHIELLGSRENIAQAKSELLFALDEGGIAFVNAADDMSETLIEDAELQDRGVEIVFFDGSADSSPRTRLLAERFGASRFVWAEDVSIDELGRPSFTLCAEGFASEGGAPAVLRETCALNVMGLHNVSNACSAAAVGLAAGMGIEVVARALADAAAERGRQEIVRAASGLTVVNDAYNANPDSMRASLATFASLAVAGKRIAVLGDMGELGPIACEAHREIGKIAAASHLDQLICAGDLARHIAAGATGAGMDPSRVTCVSDWKQALDAVAPIVTSNDAVLVKASHFMGLDRVAKGLVE